MNKDETQKKYLNLYSFEKINSFKAIAEKENTSEADAKKNYNTIPHYIGSKIGLSEIEAKTLHEELSEKINEIQDVFNKFTEDRKIGFGNFREFYNWFKKEPKKCYYCKTDESILKFLFEKKYFESKKPGWNTGILQIDKKDPDPKIGYKKENCVLSCLFCNNAKTDLISDKDFKKYIAKGIRRYLKKCFKELKKESKSPPTTEYNTP